MKLTMMSIKKVAELEMKALMECDHDDNDNYVSSNIDNDDNGHDDDNMMMMIMK